MSCDLDNPPPKRLLGLALRPIRLTLGRTAPPRLAARQNAIRLLPKNPHSEDCRPGQHYTFDTADPDGPATNVLEMFLRTNLWVSRHGSALGSSEEVPGRQRVVSIDARTARLNRTALTSAVPSCDSRAQVITALLQRTAASCLGVRPPPPKRAVRPRKDDNGPDYDRFGRTPSLPARLTTRPSMQYLAILPSWSKKLNQRQATGASMGPSSVRRLATLTRREAAGRRPRWKDSKVFHC